MKSNNLPKTEYVITKCEIDNGYEESDIELYHLSSVVTKEINWLGKKMIKEFKNFVCEGSYSYCLERKKQLEGMGL